MTKPRTSQLAPTGATTGQALVFNGTLWLPGAYDDTTKIRKDMLTTKGDLIAATGAATPARVGVGANNAVLTADSSSASGVGWRQPDAIKHTLIDAKGDLVAGGGDNLPLRLPVGANGQLLTADSTTATGLAWTPPTGSAEAISFTPFGTVQSTNVQAAIEELSVEGGSSGGGGGHKIEDEGVLLAQRPNLNFVGVGVQVSDDPANNETRVEVTGVTATSATFTRTSAAFTTPSLTKNATSTGLVPLAAGYRLYTLDTTRPCRLRLYDSEANREADFLRPLGTLQKANSGLMFEYVTEIGATTATLSPLVDGFVHTGTSAAWTVENLGTTGTITVTLTYVRTE